MTIIDFSEREETLLNRYFAHIEEHKLYSSKENLDFYLKYLFRNMCFQGKTMLEVGGGVGLFSFYAACRGASEVICLEPEAAGSSSGYTDAFHKFQNALPELSQVRLDKSTLQEAVLDGKSFDIVLLHNSINHLDENACTNLLMDAVSQDIYSKIFSEISGLCDDGAKLIITDCSRYNLCQFLNIKNPFDDNLEWHKHQSPELWSKMLSAQGFSLESIRWASPNRLRLLGRLLLGNKLVSFLITSQFCLSMIKEKNQFS